MQIFFRLRLKTYTRQAIDTRFYLRSLSPSAGFIGAFPYFGYGSYNFSRWIAALLRLLRGNTGHGFGQS
jgi:hypothetical protein